MLILAESIIIYKRPILNWQNFKSLGRFYLIYMTTFLFSFNSWKNDNKQISAN